MIKKMLKVYNHLRLSGNTVPKLMVYDGPASYRAVQPFYTLHTHQKYAREGWSCCSTTLWDRQLSPYFSTITKLIIDL